MIEPSAQGGALAFAELFAKTNYSFLEGASHPEELVEQAKALGYAALGITDRHGVYGLPRAYTASRKLGVKLLCGAELSVEGGAALILLAQNRVGYGNLCFLLTQAHQAKSLELSLSTLAENTEGLFAFCPFPFRGVEALKELFGKRLFLIGQRLLEGTDTERLKATVQTSKRFSLSVVASQAPLFHTPQRKRLQDVLTCIRHQTTLEEAGFRLLPNAERYLKPVRQIYPLFADFPDWCRLSVAIAGQCVFSLSELRYHYPCEWIPPGETAVSYLETLVWQGARRVYGENLPEKVERQLRHELSLVKDLHYSDYFLTIWDVVQYARGRGILCQGRGSAANSVICYVLGITAVDPVRMDLLFERFISVERHEPPDIDIDFEHERREEVIQYLYERYGRERAAITAETICFRRKSAFREVGKVFGVSVPTIERLQRLTHRSALSASIVAQEFSDLPPDYLPCVQEIQGFPRHIGTHVGGFVLSQSALNRLVPIEPAAIAGRTIIQWNKEDLESLGFVKVDILGLGILTCIRKTLSLLKEKRGIELTLSTIPTERPEVYEAISRADTVGVFQIESRAQMSMLPRLKPRCFYDLVIEVSLVRPGPIQGGMVHPYLRRRAGLEGVQYPHPDLEGILGKTLGVPLFQEQIMKMAMAVAGFTGGEADELRRAMGTWRYHGGNRLSHLGDKFRQGLISRGIGKDFAQQIFRQIEGFAKYGFPESHAASFAGLAYATAYLKVHYPDAYLVGLLNSQPMGFYSVSSLIEDAKRHGVEVEGVSLQFSDWDNTLAGKNRVRLGFRQVHGLSRKVADAVLLARASGAFGDFCDFIHRLKESLWPHPLRQRDLYYLAGAHAFQTLGVSRREAFWKIAALQLQGTVDGTVEEETVPLPNEGHWERVALDYEHQGVSLEGHPLSVFRTELRAKGALASNELGKVAHGRRARVAGLVICRQMPPTASGVLFLTLEDERGFINLVVWNRVLQRFREALLSESLLWCEGKIQRAEGVTHLVVDKVEPLVGAGSRLRSNSYDFH